MSVTSSHNINAVHHHDKACKCLNRQSPPIGVQFLSLKISHRFASKLRLLKTPKPNACTVRLMYVNSQKAGIGFTEQNYFCTLKFLKFQILYLSRINDPIPGMFVFIWMHFSWWFQIRLWNSKIFTFVENVGTFWRCRLLTPAAWFYLLSRSIFALSNFWNFNCELMNQYQACLHLFECISHGDSKYGNEIKKCSHFWNFWWHFGHVVCSVTPAAW